MKRFVSILLLATLTAVATGGCAPVLPPRPTPTTPAATATLPATVSPSPATSTPLPSPANGVALKAYFLYHEKVQPAARVAPAGTADEKAAGLVTMIPTGTKLRGVRISGTVATVDLSAAFASGGGSLSMTDRLAQVVYTATQFSGVHAVSLQLDGKPIKVLGGEGIIVDHPRTRKSCEGETPAILIDEPPWRGTLRAGHAVSGTADVFEAMFRIEIRDSSGALVFSKSVKATSGTGTRGTWSITPTLTGAVGGVGSIRVYEPSAKDGSPVHVVKVPVTIEL
jgi:hypothetical protein